MSGSRCGASRNALAAIVSLLDEAFDDFTFTELITLLAVCEHEGLSVTSVARVCRFTEATASRTVRRLSPADMPGVLPPARGLLTLVRAPNDNRSRYVFLTARGRALCHAIDDMIGDPARVRLVGADSCPGASELEPRPGGAQFSGPGARDVASGSVGAAERSDRLACSLGAGS